MKGVVEISAKVDFELLMEQKKLLLNLIWEDLDHPLWGLVNLLDSIEDTIDPPALQ